MKRILTLALLTSCALSSSAYAMMRVTNLDHVAHRVVLRSAGTDQAQIVQPHATIYFQGNPDGWLSLRDDPKAKHVKSNDHGVHTYGILSGVIGEGGNEGIPVTNDDELVIWQDGNLLMQRHRDANRF